MGKHRSSELKKEQIVQALMRVMGQHGYERSSIAAIAKEADIRSGLVHYHFSNKQEILLALVEHLAQRLKERYERRLLSVPNTPQAKLDAFIDAHVGLGSDASIEAVKCWVSIGAEALHLDDVREAYVRNLRITQEQLKLHIVEWLASEGRKIDGVHDLAAGIMSAIEGAYALAMVSSDLTPKGFAAPTIQKMAYGWLHAQPFHASEDSEGVEE